MTIAGLETEVARIVWAQRYRHGGSAEPDIAATWRRVATALAQAEPSGARIGRRGSIRRWRGSASSPAGG